MSKNVRRPDFCYLKSGLYYFRGYSLKLLEERIKQDGVVLPGNVLKINQFLNHQIDPQLMYEIGQEFERLFKGEAVTKDLDGRSFRNCPSYHGWPCDGCSSGLCAKEKPSTLDSDVYAIEVYSYTKKVTNTISVDQKFLTETDRVLVIDDFLANGQAVLGLLEICQQANAHIVGAGVVVEKSFQDGAKLIKRARGKIGITCTDCLF